MWYVYKEAVLPCGTTWVNLEDFLRNETSQALSLMWGQWSSQAHRHRVERWWLGLEAGERGGLVKGYKFQLHKVSPRELPYSTGPVVNNDRSYPPKCAKKVHPKCSYHKITVIVITIVWKRGERKRREKYEEEEGGSVGRWWLGHGTECDACRPRGCTRNSPTCACHTCTEYCVPVTHP